MAYFFPDAPLVGQESNGYIWDGQKWVKRQPGDATISSTPPTNAHSGQLWWDSDSGDLYIYYNDGTSAQWVGVDTGSGVSTASVVKTSDTLPADNGDITFQLVSDTQLTIHVKGADGTVRSVDLTLA